MKKNEIPTAAILGVFVLICLLVMLGTGLLNPLLNWLAQPSAVPSVAPVPLGGGGGLIAFESRRDGNPEIYVMSMDGSYKKNLTDNPANDWGPAWSPDGERIAFLSERTGKSQIYVMNADGSGMEHLTGNNVDANWGGPLSWSPDGSRLVASAYFIRNERWSSMLLYLINSDGTGNEPLSLNQSDQYNDFSPKWSPGGRYIAYLSYRYTTTGLYVIDLETGKQMTLSVSGSMYIPEFDWYPDGTKLAYLGISRLPGGASGITGELRAIDMDGSNDILLHSFERIQ
jgi:Tol biopolymer transport system component